MDLSSRLNRVYNLEMGNYQAIQHAVRPEVIYEYVPEVSQADLPTFDKLDRNQAHHDLLFGFSTFLTTKEVQKDAENNPVTNYREICRLQILQQFNIERPPLDLLYQSRTQIRLCRPQPAPGCDAQKLSGANL